VNSHKYFRGQLGKLPAKETLNVSKKSQRRRKSGKYMEQNNEIIDFGQFRKRENRVKILPKNLIQEQYITHINDPQKDIIFAYGPAGTGKTYIAVLAAIQALKEGRCQKIVLTRPAVSVDEQHGFLPGTLIEKMAPWTRPLFDVFEEYYSPQEINHMISENIIEVAPLAYMRGRSIKGAYMIADEAQNMTLSQMKMFLTRMAEGSRILVTGDLKQHDRGFSDNGLRDVLNRIENDNGDGRIAAVRFSKSHSVRHETVEIVLRLYGED
jgi:phosphate starvation-inducible protein PhoH and related proteins